MALSNSLIYKFLKATADDSNKKEESTNVDGKVVIVDGVKYVKLDGSERLTPVKSQVNVRTDDRVTVEVKNHTATIIGSQTNPAATLSDSKDTNDKVTSLYSVVAEKATIGALDAATGRISTLESDNLTVQQRLSSSEASIGTLTTDNATINKNLSANTADISDLKTSKVSTTDLQSKYATIDQVKATKGSIYSLDSVYATISNLDTEKLRVDDLLAKKAEVEDLNSATAKISTLETDNTTVKQRLDAAEANIKTLDTNKLEADSATITDLQATDASLDKLVAEKATIKSLDSSNARITSLENVNFTFEKAEGIYAHIEDLKTTNTDISNLQVDVENANTIEATDIKAVKGSIDELNTNVADIKKLTGTYATFDFGNINELSVQNLFSKSGMIKDLVMEDSKVTGELVGVHIKGDLIEANSIVADALKVKGADGLYYKLNVEGSGTPTVGLTAEQLQSGLDGTNIVAKSITADKVSVTDLVAFGADIGGFKVTSNSINTYSKPTIDATNPGIYLDTDGQVVFGDAKSYLKFYKDASSNYHMSISADDFIFSSTNKSINQVIDDRFKVATISAKGLDIKTGNSGDVHSLIDGTGLNVYSINNNVEKIIAQFNGTQSLIQALRIIGELQFGSHSTNVMTWDDVDESGVATTDSGTGLYWIGDVQ